MNQEAKFTNIVKLYALTGAVWAFVGTLAGLVNQAQIITGWPGPESMLSYGYLRPIYTTMLIFGSALSFFFASAYYTMRHQGVEELKLEFLGIVGYVLHLFAMFMGIAAILGGGNSGREFGELNWIADNALILAFVLFLAVVSVNLKSRLKISRSMMLFVVAGAGALVAYFLGKFSEPYSTLSGAFMSAGVQDMAVQEFYRYGILGFVLLIPAFAMIFQFLPEHLGVDLHSESMANFLGIGLLILVPLAGAASMMYTPAPVASAAVGVVAAIAIFVVLISGLLNTTKTVEDATGDAKHDDVTGFLKMGAMLLIAFGAVRAITSLGMVQMFVGYTWLNMNDIAVDAQTYVLMVAFGAGFVIMQKSTGKRIPEAFMNIQFYLMLGGAAIVLLANVLGGALEARAFNAVTPEGVLAVEKWGAVISAGSLGHGDSPAGMLMGVKGLAVLGQLALFFGAGIGLYNLFSTVQESGAEG